MEQEKETVEVEEKVTSLDLLWKQSLQELDAWNERASLREEALLRNTKRIIENMKRNQSNAKELLDQLVKEQREWEKTAREELLTSTTSLQYLFPIKSYEEINKVMDNFQSKTTELSKLQLRPFANGEHLDYYVKSVEQYIEFRKKSRIQFLDNLKSTLNIIHENQRGMINLFSKQLKNVLFPFNKYIERSSEVKS
ncbi:hypothetical protein [Alkalihalobacterium chitinilyticum]|uniref:Uncharacterized protein n=1 Tax=Alkalihalobacterium chitinilyticum TaxID=2980103 RepID=A0ABT5VIC3_9BACI|nr:hypothetical protein [Alkalihalobacterium chitinilyticum]MDE5414492.1 hypothetical protein [Alkalihalobacterium chitinilyticum]